MPRNIATVNVSLPRKLRADMMREIRRQGYASASEYVRDLIRKDLRAEAIEQVDQMLLEGLRSGPGKRITEDFWRKLKAEVIKRGHRARQG